MYFGSKFPAMHLTRIILIICFLLELGLISFWRDHPSLYGWAPFVLCLASLIIGIYPIFGTRYHQDIKTRAISIPSLWQQVILFTVAAIGIIYNISPLNELFLRMPATLDFSDIIPQIDVMVRLFFWEGETPYQTIDEFGYPLFSPYMPMHWGPFVIPRLLGFDFRWLAYGVYALTYLFLVRYMHQQKLPFVFKAIWSTIPALFIHFVLNGHFDPLLGHEWPIEGHTENIFGHTIETLIMAYYLMLGLSLLHPSPYVRGLALALCLLSRYTVVLWAPLYILLVFFFEKRRRASIIVLVSGGLVMLLYVFPFLFRDFSILSQGLAHHAGVTEKAWTFEGWYAPNGKPHILSWGVGLGVFFFDHAGGEAIDRLHLLENLQLILSLLVVAIMGFAYRWLQERIPLHLYLLLSLKVFLTVFYNLNPLPFVYYLMVPISLSMIIIPAVWAEQTLGNALSRIKMPKVLRPTGPRKDD